MSPNRYQAKPMSASLYIRNVNVYTRPEHLRELFSPYGRLCDVYIPLDYFNRQPRGFAFDDFRDAEDAIYELQGVRLQGSRLDIEFARGDRKTPREMRYQKDLGYGSHSRDGYRSPSPSPRRRRNSSPKPRSRSPSRRRHRRHSHRRRETSSHSSSSSPDLKNLVTRPQSTSPSKVNGTTGNRPPGAESNANT